MNKSEKFIVRFAYGNTVFSRTYKYLRHVEYGSDGRVISVSLVPFRFLAKVYKSRYLATKEANSAYSFSDKVSSYYSVISL